MSLYDFKMRSSLEFTSLDSTASWSNVEETVAPVNKCGPCVVVQGRLHGLERWAAFSGDTKIILTANHEEDRDRWVQELYLRVALWQLLHLRACETMVNASLGTQAAESARQVGVLCDALDVRFASMFPEFSRGRRERPQIFDEVRKLVDSIKESVTSILKSVPDAKEECERILEDTLFEVLVAMFDHMGEVEEHLMRSWGGEAVDSNVLKKVELGLHQLKTKVGTLVLDKETEDLKARAICL